MRNKINPPQIIDTNVICEAGKTEYSTMSPLAAKCAGNCYDFIFNFIRDPDSRIVLDVGWEMVKEYENNVPKAGQPTLANKFMNWLYLYLAKMPYEDLIDIKPKGSYVYETFPDDSRLDGFDPPEKNLLRPHMRIQIILIL